MLNKKKYKRRCKSNIILFTALTVTLTNIGATFTLADDPTCDPSSGQAPQVTNPQTIQALTQTARLAYPAADKQESCLSKLGPNAHIILDCMEDHYQSLRGVGVGGQDCVNKAGPGAEQRAAAWALSAHYSADRLSSELSSIAAKIDKGETVSKEEAELIVTLREQLREQLAADVAKPEAIELLKKNGASFDKEKGWELSKFNFGELQSPTSPESLAIKDVFGEKALQGLRKIYFGTEQDIASLNRSGRPVTVVLGNTAIIPNIQISAYGKVISRVPQVMRVEQFEAEVSNTYASLKEEAKAHLKSAATVNSFTNQLGSAFRAFHSERRTSARQKLDRTAYKINRHSQDLEYRLGLDPNEMGKKFAELQAVFKDASMTLDLAIQKIEKIDLGVKGALLSAFVIASAGWAAPILGLASTGTVLTYTGVGLGITTAIATGDAISQAAARSAHGGGDFWCNLGSQMIGAQAGNFYMAPVTAALSLVFPKLGTPARLLGYALFGYQVAGRGGSIDQYKEAEKLSHLAVAVRAAGHESAALSIEREAAAIKTGAIYRPLATAAVIATSEIIAARASRASGAQNPSGVGNKPGGAPIPGSKQIVDLKIGETASVYRADGNIYEVTYYGGNEHWYSVKGPGIGNGPAFTLTELSTFLNQVPPAAGAAALQPANGPQPPTNPLKTFWSDQRGSMVVGTRTPPPPTRADTGGIVEVTTGVHTIVPQVSTSAPVVTAAAAISPAIADAAIAAAAVTAASATTTATPTLPVISKDIVDARKLALRLAAIEKFPKLSPQLIDRAINRLFESKVVDGPSITDLAEQELRMTLAAEFQKIIDILASIKADLPPLPQASGTSTEGTAPKILLTEEEAKNLQSANTRIAQIESVRAAMVKKYPDLTVPINQIIDRIFLAEFMPELLKNKPVTPIFLIGPPGIGKTTVLAEITTLLGLNNVFNQISIQAGQATLDVEPLTRAAAAAGGQGTGVQAIVVFDEVGGLVTPQGADYRRLHNLPIPGDKADNQQKAAYAAMLARAQGEAAVELMLNRQNVDSAATERRDQFWNILWQLSGNGQFPIDGGRSLPNEDYVRGLVKWFQRIQEKVLEIEQLKQLKDLKDEDKQRLTATQLTLKNYLNDDSFYGILSVVLTSYPGVADGFTRSDVGSSKEDAGKAALAKRTGSLTAIQIAFNEDPIKAIKTFYEAIAGARTDQNASFERGIIIFTANDLQLVADVMAKVKNQNDPDEVRAVFKELFDKNKDHYFLDLIFGSLGEPDNVPAFLSRIGLPSYILPPGKAQWMDIARNMATDLVRTTQAKLKDKFSIEVGVEIDPSVIERIYAKGVDPLRGPRKITAIANGILTPVLQKIMTMLLEQRLNGQASITKINISLNNATNELIVTDQEGKQIITVKCPDVVLESEQDESKAKNLVDNLVFRSRALHESGKIVLGSLVFGAVPESVSLSDKIDGHPTALDTLWPPLAIEDARVARATILATVGGIAAEKISNPTAAPSSGAEQARAEALRRLKQLRETLKIAPRSAGQNLQEYLHRLDYEYGMDGFSFSLLADSDDASIEAAYTAAVNSAVRYLADHQQALLLVARTLEKDKVIGAEKIRLAFERQVVRPDLLQAIKENPAGQIPYRIAPDMDGLSLDPVAEVKKQTDGWLKRLWRMITGSGSKSAPPSTGEKKDTVVQPASILSQAQGPSK